MLKKRFFKILGGLIVLSSLFGFSWYTIMIQPEKDLWYIFNYSPFYFKINVSEIVDVQWFYRIDSSIIGILIIITVAFTEIYSESKKVTFVSTFILFLISILFVSFLPIHLTSASRLVLDKGLYIFWFGSLLILSTIFFEK